MVHRALVEGLQVTVERKDKLGYALKIHNPTGTAITVSCDVESWVTEGSRMGRMVPRPQLKKSEPLELSAPCRSSCVSRRPR
jgi:hypothetical protein